MKRVLLPACLLLLNACVTAPETTKDLAPAGPETPDVPYAPKTVAATTPAASTGGAEVIKPATGGTAPAAEAAAPPAPVAPTFDGQTQSRFKEGVAALSQGNTDVAERAFKDVLDRNDKAAYAWTNLGLIKERRGDVGDAERNYRRALEIDPGQDVAWDYLARLQCRQRKCAQVETELRAALLQKQSVSRCVFL